MTRAVGSAGARRAPTGALHWVGQPRSTRTSAGLDWRAWPRAPGWLRGSFGRPTASVPGPAIGAEAGDLRRHLRAVAGRAGAVAEGGRGARPGVFADRDPS